MAMDDNSDTKLDEVSAENEPNILRPRNSTSENAKRESRNTYLDSNPPSEDDEESKAYKQTAIKFRKRFNFPEEEKLVNYYSCSYWKSMLPRQGWMYLSINHFCFYSFMMGNESSVCLRWNEITSIDRKSNVVGSNRIVVGVQSTVTRNFIRSGTSSIVASLLGAAYHTFNLTILIVITGSCHKAMK